jgi:hypothetical protein
LKNESVSDQALWASGSKEIFSFVPVAVARRSSVRVEGFTRPLSRRAMTAWVVPDIARSYNVNQSTISRLRA